MKNWEELLDENRVFKEFGNKKISQRIIDNFNSKGYKLYYYKNFELIEITNIKSKWETKWSSIIFFLNDEEVEKSKETVKLSKEIYNKYIEQSNLIAEYPLSFIYNTILKNEN